MVDATLPPLPLLLNDGHCGHWVDVQRRVRERQPLRMMAIGSSIVGSHGGCTHAVPGVCEQSQCPNCCGLRCMPGDGWLRDVFNELNRSWPHPENALMSLGQPGGGLAASVNSCMRDYIRQQRIDVFFLELSVTGPGGNDLELEATELVRTLVHDQRELHATQPLIFFTSFNFVEAHESVALGGLPPANPARLHRNEFEKITLKTEVLQRIARRLGYPHFSPWPLHQHLSLPTKQREWDPDLLHPRVDRSMIFHGWRPRERDATPGPTWVRGGASPHTAPLVALPIALAIARGVHECPRDATPPPSDVAHTAGGATGGGGTGGGGGGDGGSGGVPAHWSCLRWRPNGTFAASSPHVASSFTVLGLPSDHGFYNVTYERGSGQNRWRVKPGLRSDRAGSEWSLGIHVRPRRFTMRLEYLTSYEGMGAASLRCRGRCECEQTKLDATTRDRASVNTVTDIVVTQQRRSSSGSEQRHAEADADADADAGEGCIVRLEVLQPSFKLSSLAVSPDFGLGEPLGSGGGLRRKQIARWTNGVWSSTDNMLAQSQTGHGPIGTNDGFNGPYAESKPAWIT